MKVIHQESTETVDGEAPARVARPRPNAPLRFAPLTGAVMTDASGGLVVRRVRVRVVGGPDRGREALLEAGTLLVGTHTDNDLILRDPQVGKYHLEIALVAGGIRVRDLGSDAGTFVASQRITSGVVTVGTELQLGRTTLHLLAGDLTVNVSPSERTAFGMVVGQSLPMRMLFALLERVAPSDVPLLLQGPTGAGRTLIAKAIHANSRFAASPITVVDFRLPQSERPTVTQVSQRADTFTLLLEGLDEASTGDHGALLSLYQRREEGVLDARIIATSTTDIQQLAAAGRMRSELAVYVSSVRLRVPALSERIEDIPMLVQQFCRDICGAEAQLRPEDFDRIAQRDYPGNVRELRQLIAKALQVEVTAPPLPKSGIARARAALVMPLNARPKPPHPKVARDRLVEYFEKDWLMGLMKRADNNVSEVARELNLPRREAIKLLKKHSITCPDR